MSLLGKISVFLGLDTSDFIKGTRDAERQTQDMTSKISGAFKKFAGGLAIGAAIKKAFDFGKEAYQAAAQAQGVKIAFDRLNDPNLLNNLKSATKETVDELKLMQLSVQAKNFRLPLDQMGTYLKFATKRAQETGQSVDYLTNSIITGLGRKSLLILDNLGISTLEIREEMKKSGDMAKAVGSIIQREMAKAGDITETAAIKAEKISAKWSDFKGSLGDTTLIQKAGSAIQDFLIGAIDRLSDLLTGIGNSEVQSWLGKINTQNDIAKAEAIRLKLQEVNSEIASLERNTPKGWFDKGVHNMFSGIASLFGAETDYAKLGKLKNYRVSISDSQQADELKKKRDAKLIELNLEKKTDEELLSLKEYYKANRIGYEISITEAIIAEQTARLNKQAELDEKTTEKAKELEEERRKARFSYKESDNTAAIAQLEKQESAYGDTIAYMEAMLKLRREQEQYAKSDAEYNRIKKENDELEKQVKLRKVDYQKGSEVDLKNQLSDAESEMSKLNTRTVEGKARFIELSTIIENINWQISNLPQNIKIDFEVNTTDLTSDIDDQIQSILDSYDSGVGAMLERQKEFAAQFKDTIEKGAEASIASLGEAIGALASGNTDQIWQMLLNPIADMSIQLGQLAIAAGITFDALGKAMKNPFGGGIGAVVAGVALVALGTAIKGAISNIGNGGGGNSSSGGGNTFTGGYSNGGAHSNSGMSRANIFSGDQSQQVVVLETRVSGSDLMLVQSKEQNRRNR